MLEALKRIFAAEEPKLVRVRGIVPEVSLGHKSMLRQGETVEVDPELAELLIYKGQAERV